jgi:hypothetical protein
MSPSLCLGPASQPLTRHHTAFMDVNPCRGFFYICSSQEWIMVFEWSCELRLTAHRSGACGTDSDGVHECGHHGLPDLQPLGQQLGDQAVDVRPQQIPQLPARHSHSLERLHTDSSTQCNTMVHCDIFWHASELGLVPYTYTSLWLSTHAFHMQLPLDFTRAQLQLTLPWCHPRHAACGQQEHLKADENLELHLSIWSFLMQLVLPHLI